VTTLLVSSPADLGPAQVLRIARDGAVPVLADDLADRLTARRARLVEALAGDTPVYGVNTGMGAMSQHRLGPADQARHQESLMLARSVGGPPWLRPAETRAVLAVRLRTLLNGDSGVSADLCRQLTALLAHHVLPAVPRTAMGVAGEIIALAHLAAPLAGTGQVLDVPNAVPAPAAPPSGSGQVLDGSGAVPALKQVLDDPGTTPTGPAPAASGAGQVLGGSGAVAAGPVLAAAGLVPVRLGPKEGVALIQGVPATTGLAILCAADARAAVRQAVHLLAAEFALTAAARDVLHPALGRADDVLAALTAEVRRLAGDGAPRALQPPVSFRVSLQVLAHVRRALAALDGAVLRALDGVTDSPAFVSEDGTDRFVGTAGFGGYDLAGHLHFVTAALVTAADVGATRLHRLMDPAVSGLPAQLSPEPGPHTGLSTVHKRAVGVVHGMRRLAVPAAVGPIETSLGQEDVQSFSFEAAEACRAAVTGLTDVLAAELLAVHQARCLGASFPDGAAPELAAALDTALDGLPTDPRDRPFGQDLTHLRAVLAAGWLGPPRDP
jgi:histidine ammonia-lyase